MMDFLEGYQLKFFSVEKALASYDDQSFTRMPYSVRVFCENVLRRQPPEVAGPLIKALAQRRHDVAFPFYPARVLLHDGTGIPALVDLAGLREEVARAGGEPDQVNPAVPTHVVVDHSLIVEVGGNEPDAVERNMAAEQDKNAERFEFLAWSKQAFSNLEVFMPGRGILHQINLEYLSPVIQEKDGMAFPDSLAGADSHTPMIDALGVIGWGVGGIEAEAVMLGRPIWMLLPEIVGVGLRGKPGPGIFATDLVLTLTEYLRAEGVVGAIIEFFGEGVDNLALADRATISNMTPEFGASAAMFPIDRRTLDFMRLTGRSEAQIALTETYAKSQGLWAGTLLQAEYDRRLSFNLSDVTRSIAGPTHPQQRIALSKLKEHNLARVQAPVRPPEEVSLRSIQPISDGAIVIAAITSCTNTSNPRSMLAAGLLARNAVKKGLERQPWVKTSLAPGSRAVARYLESAELMEPLQTLGFGLVGFGCTTCDGFSGRLAPKIEEAITSRNLDVVAVLSGNRNFKGRIHALVERSFLSSPALVIAYALAGSIQVDIKHDPLGYDPEGRPVRLEEIWPSDEEIDAVLTQHVRGEQFLEVYKQSLTGRTSDTINNVVSPFFPWRLDSTYIRRPPFGKTGPGGTSNAPYQGMRALAILGDNVTTDHLSPSGAILPESPAGQFLSRNGVARADFNTYLARRGNYQVAVRATLASNRLHNEMVPGKEGSFTRLQPGGAVLPLYEAIEKYLERGQELIIVAGKNYGSGSSRDWAAKGVGLVGVRAIVCENFERIHRSNLINVGVLPLEFEPGITRQTLGLDGTELYSLSNLREILRPAMAIILNITRRDGSILPVPLRCRIDTNEEAEVFNAGGFLPLVLKEFSGLA